MPGVMVVVNRREGARKQTQGWRSVCEVEQGWCLLLYTSPPPALGTVRAGDR
jgi:hypothetical protein